MTTNYNFFRRYRSSSIHRAGCYGDGIHQPILLYSHSRNLLLQSRDSSYGYNRRLAGDDYRRLPAPLPDYEDVILPSYQDCAYI